MSHDLIHKFYLNNMFIILDVHGGSIHVVDEIVYDLVDFIQKMSLNEIIASLHPKYSIDEITEAYSEVKEIIDAGYLFTPAIAEENIKYNPENIVKALCLHVSHDCDLRCRYCFASQGDFQGERLLMDAETGKKALDFLVSNSGNRRNLEVDLFGGEPLLNFSVIEEIVEYGFILNEKYNKNIRFTITTNGLSLDDEKIDYINKYMHNVVMSLDGRQKINDAMRQTVNGRGSYATIVPKFKKLIEKRGDKQYYIRGTFTAENLDFTNDALDYLANNFTKFSIEPVVTDLTDEYAIRKEHVPQILKEYEKLSKLLLEYEQKENDIVFYHFTMDLDNGPCLAKRSVGCGAGSEYLSITPTGDIYPCHQFVGNDEFLLGNLEEGIHDADLREKFRNANIFNKEDCDKCWARYYCSGGCHANAYHSNQDILRPYDVGCDLERKRVECAISMYANRLENS